MMLNELLGELARLGIKVWANGEQLGINAPAGALTPELREALLENKLQLLNILKNKASSEELLPTLEPLPAERHQPFPLTDIQQAYWIGRKGNFELGDVGVHFYAEIENETLDVECLTAAWQKVINRHEMLRAVVLPDGTQQILAEIPSYQIALLDLSGQTPAAAEMELLAIRRKMSHQLYSAETWPLFEIRATKLPSQRIRLHISMDILMVDGSGILSILQEWVQVYKNPGLKLPAPAISFRDYMLAAQKLQQSDLYERSKKYWFDRLDTLPPSPQLPVIANFNPTKQRFQRYNQELAPEQWQRLKARASQAGLTPSGVLLAAFAEVLTTWSKSAQFTLNLTLFSRLPLHPQVHEIIGDFTTINLLAVNNAAAEPFQTRAVRLQKQLWQDLSHYYISGVEVIRELVRRRKDRMGVVMPVVFTSTLGIQHAKAQGNDDAIPLPASLEDLGEMLYTISQTPQVWLDHTMRERGNGALVLSWDVVAGLFPAGFIEEMFAVYGQLLHRLATEETSWTEPYQCLMPPAQLAERSAYNATEYPISEVLLHTLFLAQAKANPQQISVISAERSLTYGELYEQANQVGHWLRERGAKPNTLVAIIMDKGWEQVVAVLGVLLSGAAYLPIDPALPAERQHYLLEQGQTTLALTQFRLVPQLSWPNGVQFLCVDSHTPNSPAEPLSITQSPTDLAYVIYTSGSTGLPKGVVIDHRGAVNTVLDINRRFNVTGQDRVLALSALNFDLSVYDIFGLLAIGGAIVMPSADQRRDPAHWAELMTQHGVTIWDTVPALMQMLVDYQSGQPLNTPLKLVMMSGDWIPLDLPERIKTLWPQAQVMSLGGATEASIWSIYYPIEQVDPTWKSIPYGFPLTNQQFHVLNALLEPCPLWVTGDLYIGGIGLALGYWRDETKTNASFITHPRTGERLYKTGDLGRFVPDTDGRPVIEFLGREDFQVKIRGHRIELGEIEAALLKHPAVKEAVVNAVGNDRHNKQLVAYVVTDGEGIPTAQARPVEKYAAQAGILQDPVERLQFKLNQPGLRPSTESSVYLIAPEFDAALTEAYLARQSYREFLADPIPLREFSLFLSCLLQMQIKDSPLPKYRYPSGGGLYPIQTYVYLKAECVEGLEAGYYYYHPAEHRLVLLQAGATLAAEFYGQPGDTNRQIFDQAGFALLLVGQMQAIEPIYGHTLAQKLSLVEAGYMGQLLMTQAPQYHIGLCPIGDVESFADLRAALGLEVSHILLHSFLGGKIDAAQSKQWLQQPLPQKSTLPLEEQLSAHLAGKLPVYMIPASYLFLEALPLTANGKVNRQALPQPEALTPQRAEAFVAPRNPLEEQLVTIWSNLLKLPQVSVMDNFFDVGGDSLSATRIVAQIREQFQVELPIVTMFDNPTIATLAEQIVLLKTAQKLQNVALNSTGTRKQGRL